MDELISKTDVVKIVKSVLSPASSLTNVARARRQMLDQIYKLESKPEPHWIPVTEDTLPEENRVVVVCGNKGTWDYGTYRGHGDNIHFWHWKKNTYKRVYWWMYKEDALPEPYKEVTE